eukprot:2340166-Pyramimonas_sp.AAC.1
MSETGSNGRKEERDNPRKRTPPGGAFRRAISLAPRTNQIINSVARRAPRKKKSLEMPLGMLCIS